MGLDMYLNGRKYLWRDYKHPEADQKVDGFRVQQIEISIGYWRKHPDLHGYIVKNFADGKDECQEIELTIENLKQIAGAVESKRLPHTEGFFFGASDDSPEQIKEDLKIINEAIDWLKNGDVLDLKPVSLGAGMTAVAITPDTKMPDQTRSVYYRASW